MQYTLDDFQTMHCTQCFKQLHNCCGHCVSPQQTTLISM